jgi:aminoglycoside 6'-N-acetyltransferase
MTTDTDPGPAGPLGRLGAEAPTLDGRLVRLRPAIPSDLPRLRAILTAPSVARWWGLVGPGRDVAEEWLDADDDTLVLAIEAEGDVIGSIQAAEETDRDYRHAALDVFVAPESQGQGFGSDAIRTLAQYLFEVRLHHRLTIDPSASNERAIAVYRKLGFRPVGIMRAYERGPDGTFHDGLLLDLLLGELR